MTELCQALFQIVPELRRTDKVCRNVLVAEVRRLLAGLFERRKVTTAEPCERKEIKLLIDIEGSERALKLLQSRVVCLALQNVDVAVISRVRSGFGVGGINLFIEPPSLDDDIERLPCRDCQLACGF